jgi:hypothetical protein
LTSDYRLTYFLIPFFGFSQKIEEPSYIGVGEVTNWRRRIFSPHPARAVSSSHADWWLARICMFLILSVPILATAIFLKPSSVQAPTLPSGKAPLEILVEGFRAPTGVAVGPDGTVYFTDRKEGRLWQRAPMGV